MAVEGVSDMTEMNIPAHLIDFITPDELLKIREKK
jgi:hypothetical protein